MHRLTVLAGPGGVGKGTVLAALRRLDPQVWISVSWTTRAPRPGEVEGEHYHFVDDAAFAAKAGAGGFLEHAEFAGNRYGTPRAPVEQAIDRGPALLEIDVQGARQVRAAMPAASLVLLTPPSLAELGRRLAGRGTDDPGRLAQRLAIAKRELAAAPEFDEVLVNDDPEMAAARLLAWVRG